MPMEISTMVTGLRELNMDKEPITSKTGPSMMENGSPMTKMALEPLHIPMEINMRESGEMEKKAEEESTTTQMVMSMKVIGKMIRETVLVC
jgi:hypothetical protein